MPNTAPDAVASAVRVAVGVIRDSSGRILIARRPSHKHQGDLWEFPGGKIEAGESCEAALERELFEELGIRVRQSDLLICVPFHYPDKKVVLEVREVVAFDGEPSGNEGQPLRWVGVHELNNYAFPAANTPIVNAVRLPNCICVTGEFADQAELSFRISRAVSRGAGMVVLRPNRKDREAMADILRVAKATCAQERVPLVVNSSVERDLWQLADGVHLRSACLAALDRRPLGVDKWLGASCHSLAEAERALSLGVDYIFLSPVLQTESHPLVEGLGWDGFSAIVSRLGVPTFALGGLNPNDLPRARRAGAKGIAGISAFWK